MVGKEKKPIRFIRNLFLKGRTALSTLETIVSKVDKAARKEARKEAV